MPPPINAGTYHCAPAGDAAAVVALIHPADVHDAAHRLGSVVMVSEESLGRWVLLHRSNVPRHKGTPGMTGTYCYLRRAAPEEEAAYRLGGG